MITKQCYCPAIFTEQEVVTKDFFYTAKIKLVLNNFTPVTAKLEWNLSLVFLRSLPTIPNVALVFYM